MRRANSEGYYNILTMLYPLYEDYCFGEQVDLRQTNKLKQVERLKQIKRLLDLSENLETCIYFSNQVMISAAGLGNEAIVREGKC